MYRYIWIASLFIYLFIYLFVYLFVVTGSVCKTIGLEECQCTDSDKLCEVCCVTNDTDTCTSTFELSVS